MGAALASRIVGEFALSPALLDRTVQDSCNGDSGGPMTRLIGKQRVLVGLVSWGRGCGIPGVPGIYTRVAAYLPWIESTRRLSRPGVMDRY